MNDASLPVSPAPLPEVVQVTPAGAVLPQAAPRPERRLRLWPGIVIVTLLWLVITVPGWLAPEKVTIQFQAIFLGPMVAAALLAAWWLFASRIRWSDRLLGLLACAALGAGAFALSHSSFGLFGIVIYALPTVLTAWVAWLLVTPFLPRPIRRVGLLVVLLLAWGYFPLLRLEGVDGSFSATFDYRWSRTAEEKLLAEIAAGRLKPGDASAVSTLTLQAGDWPGFRGPNRDNRLPGVRIATDWQQHPPRQVWRHRIGPGWSSFAVVGTRLYTQEQRGEDELVVCYDAESGGEVWTHRDSVRFTELVSGAGPRSTPTFHDGKIYALGASGRLNCLDAATGRVLWSQDIVADSGAKVPMWGFAASPLVAEGVVTVFAGGPQGKSVLGYNASSGKLAWSAGEGQLSYCSLHLARLGGLPQLLITTNVGLTAFGPAEGKVLWQHAWPTEQDVARIVQPTLVGDADVLIGTGMEMGTRRIRIAREGDRWTTIEVWTSRALKPYFNDVVVHRDHVYGFDSGFFTCVSLEDGTRKWRTRGYGSGQVLLLPDQDLLLVLSEKGEVALVQASPGGHKELGRFKAIEGKTWNHPVVARGKLFVRNGEEAACYQLMEEAGVATVNR